MKKKLNKTTKSNLITYAMVVIVYIIVQLLVSGGAVSSLMKGLLVPLCVYSILAVSLNLTVGILGELSLGHAGFMCIGAFTSATFSKLTNGVIQPAGFRFFLAILVGAVFAGIFGLLIGIPVLRLKGDYLAIVTLAFGEIGLTGDLRAVQNGEKILREAGHLGFERVVLPIRNAERLKKTLASINKERQEKGLQPVKMVGIKNISEVQNLF